MDAFLGLLQAAGAAQSPQVQVFDTNIIQNEPPIYVVLWGFAPPDEIPEQSFFDAALGSFTFYETFNLCGRLAYFQGNTDPATIRDSAWTLFNSMVMAPVIQNRGQPAGNPVLGSSAPANLMWIIPVYAKYMAAPATIGGGGQAGWQGVIDFGFNVKARITPA